MNALLGCVCMQPETQPPATAVVCQHSSSRPALIIHHQHPARHPGHICLLLSSRHLQAWHHETLHTRCPDVTAGLTAPTDTQRHRLRHCPHSLSLSLSLVWVQSDTTHAPRATNMPVLKYMGACLAAANTKGTEHASSRINDTQEMASGPGAANCCTGCGMSRPHTHMIPLQHTHMMYLTTRHTLCHTPRRLMGHPSHD